MRHPRRQRRLIASLAETGQQTPIVVVGAEGEAGRYVVIDGYKRIAALQQLGKDTVEAVVWPLSEAEAVLLDRSLRLSEHETALEQGWLLHEMEQRFNYGLDQLARRFDRSVSWVSRRLALVDVLPESIQQQVREGKISSHIAMRFLIPMARIHLEDCLRMAEIFVQQHCDSRQAGQLYTAWRKGSALTRQRILKEPELFIKTQQQQTNQQADGDASQLLRDLETVQAILNRIHRTMSGAEAMDLDDQQRETAQRQIRHAQQQLSRLAERMEKEQDEHAQSNTKDGDSGVARQASEHPRNRASVATIARSRTPGAAEQQRAVTGIPTARESRTIPATDPGAFAKLQGQPGSSP